MLGFKFKERHSDTMGIIVQSVSRPILAEAKTNISSPQMMDGSVDASKDNGRLYYDDKIITMKLRISTSNIYEMTNKIKEIALWMQGTGELAFDDMQGLYYNARVYNEVDYCPQLYGQYAELSVSFRVPPYALGSKVSESLQLEADVEQKIDTLGNWYTPFTVSIAAGTETGTLYINKYLNDEIEKSFSINGALNGLVINMGTKEVYKGDTYYTKLCNRAFFDISSETKIGFKSMNALEVTLEYEPRFFI